MPSNLNLDYYYGNEAEQYSFYRIPQTLLTDPRYQSVSIEAKVLYGLLLDRMGLSVKNGWLDSDRRIYIYFTLEDAMQMMSCGHNKAVKLFADLEQTGQIERRKQGQGRPARIYVKNFILPPLPGQTEGPEPSPPPPADSQTSDFGKSALPGTGSPDFPKEDANKTEKKKTDMNDTDPSIFLPTPAARDRPSADRGKQRMRMDEMESYRALIRENIEYDLLLQDHPYDEDTLDTCFPCTPAFRRQFCIL